MKKLSTQLLFAIALLLSTNSYAQDGALDTTFINVGTGANGTVYTTAIQSDGKIIIGGAFTSYNGTASNNIARLNTDGSLDASFTIGTGATGANSNVQTTAIQSDGKILIGGYFTSYNGTAKNYIARLNTDCSLDATFTIGTGANGPVNTTAIQSDGKIIIGGNFTSYNGSTASNHIARLNTDGSLDASFTIGTGANGTVYTTAIQSDGKIIIGGQFTHYNGTASNHITRLNTDGSLDANFTIGTGANSPAVLTTAIQSDGKIIIGGPFTSYNGTASNYIARLNTDGSLDANFTIGTGTNGTVFTTAIQSDGKIIIGGGFTSYNGTASNYIARLNTNGSLDASFTIGTGADNYVRTTAIQSDGKIIIGGDFTSYNGISRNYVARINNSFVTGIVNNAQIAGLSVFPNPNNGNFTINLNKEETFSLINNLGQIVETIQLNQSNNNSATVSGMERGVYFLTGHSNTLLKYKIVVVK